MTNVLYIMSDDQRDDTMNFMPLTRNWLRGGTRFVNTQLSIPLCGPARNGFLSGQYAQGLNNGVYNHGAELQLANYANTLAPWLQAKGYFTGTIGKGWRGIAADPGWSYRRTVHTSDQEAYDFQVYNGTSSSTPARQYQTEYCGDRFEDFVDAATEPWFCWLTPSNPHISAATFACQPAPQDVLTHRNLFWPAKDYDNADKPSWMQALVPASSLRSVQDQIRGQIQELNSLDRMVDQCFLKLEAEGQLGDTVVIYGSDNGVFYGEHRVSVGGFFFPSNKNMPYNAATRVPCLMIGPGVAENETVDVPVNLQDITKTIVGIAKAVPNIPLDGEDLRFISGAPEEYEDRAILYEHFDPTMTATPVPDTPAGSGVFTATRKLIRWEASGTDQFEMYDIDTDPEELNNVANEAGRLAERDLLEARLDELQAS